jgi:hypothetical protein
MRMRAAHKGHMAHAWQHHVGYKLAFADEQAGIFAPRHRLTYKTLRLGVCHQISLVQ